MNEKELKESIVVQNRLSSILLILKILFDLIPQILLVYLINFLMNKNININNIELIFLIILISFILKEAFYYFTVKIAHEKAYNKLIELRLNIIKHLKKLSLGFFKEHSTGELTNIIQHDVEQVEVYLAHGLPEIMSAMVIPVIVLISMFTVDYRLAFAMLTGIPLMFLVKKFSQNIMKKNFQIYFNQESKMQEELMEYVKNISVIKAFAKEEVISERTLKTAKEYINWVKKSMGAVTVPMGLINIFMEIGVVIVMISGSFFLSKGEITLPRFILSIGKILTIALPIEKKDDELQSGNIEFKNVNFEYIQGSFKLQNINLLIEKNTLNAFVGPSGCGKSTIANLIIGFWDIENGQINISGKNISEYSEQSISKLIGSVQQEAILFNISIFENIAIGKENATKEEVIEAAKKAKCHDFIEALPNKYDTKVGEMGVKLSGGEKQRISIARMILKNAPILILDEAMAAVDSENEKLIEEAINDLSKNKTVITIAHHLNIIKNSNQIIVMNKGVIVDRGTHEELMNRCNFYQTMVKAQNKVDRWNLKEEVI